MPQACRENALRFSEDRFDHAVLRHVGAVQHAHLMS
jgi:hypothetical protein